MAHKLHSEMFATTKLFLSQFMKPESLPDHDAGVLADIDVEDRTLQLRDTQLGVGEFCFVQLQLCRRDRAKHHWLPSFSKALRIAYETGAKALKKLPLTNKTLINLSALDPGLQKSQGTTQSLMSLARSLPNVVPESDLGKLDVELKCYGCDSQVSSLPADETDPAFRLDKDWWSQVMEMKDNGQQRFPILSVLVKALLTVFSGPLVEGSFNIMGDIVEEDRTTISLENYEATAIIKQRLKATEKTALTMIVTDEMKGCVRKSKESYHRFPKENTTKANETDKHPSGSGIQTNVNTARGSESARQPSGSCTQPQSSGSVGSARSSSTEKLPDNGSNKRKFAKAFSRDKNADKPKKAAKHDRNAGQEAPIAENKETIEDASPKIKASDMADPKLRKQFFEKLSDKLKQAAETSFYDLQQQARKANDILCHVPLSLHTDLKAQNYEIDLHAVSLFPSDVSQELCPIKIFGDGCCLPRTCSLLACGNQSQFVEMRARIVVELCLHEEFYTSNNGLRLPGSNDENLPKLYAMYSEHGNDEHLTPETIRNIYRLEVRDITKPFSYMGMWQVHAASSILHAPLLSIYPQYGGNNVRSHLHRTLFPRCVSEGTNAESQAKVGIMWTRMFGKDLGPELWRPNHFVACIPGQRPEQKESSSSRRPDIRSFFKTKTGK